MFQLCAVMLFRYVIVVSGLIPTHSATMHELLAPGNWGFLVLAASMIWHSHITNYCMHSQLLHLFT